MCNVLFIYLLTISLPIDAKGTAVAPDSVARPDSVFRTVNLGDVTVKGKERLTSLTNDGWVYRMSRNERAQKENTLQALSYVPYVNVDMDGQITVLGSPSYSLYLNGRPYDMAQTSPKAFLESMPASSIARVDVVTTPTNKYGAISSRYIINIVTKHPAVDGLTVNVGGGGSTQPTANGSFLGIVRKGKVDMSVKYDYGLNGQRNQNSEMTYKYLNPDGTTAHQWNLKHQGDGDWHTHTMRMMMKWRIDSLNTIYADAHGRINQTNFTGINDEYAPDSTNSLHHKDISRYTAGTVEANVVYRNYSPDNKNTERFTLGYHFTYNPDKRHTTKYYSGDEDMETRQNTDGGMTEHSALASWLLLVAPSHSIRLSAKNLYHLGNTNSTDITSVADDINCYSMRYYNNIAEISASYSGTIGRTTVQAGIKGDHDHFRMRLPLDKSLNFKSTHIYIMPSAMLYWMLNRNNYMTANYSTSVSRPSVVQLNPFTSNGNNVAISKGNPNLKAQYSHNLSLGWSFNGIHNLSVYTSLQYTHTTDIIQSYQYLDGDGKMVLTNGNLGKSNLATMMLNVNWNILKWLQFSLYSDGGLRHLTAKEISLDQNDWYYHLSPRVYFLLPKHFRLGGSVGIYDNLPNPWTTQKTIVMHSFYASKSFLNGHLNITVKANSPFSKYYRTETVTTLPEIQSRQTNDITARSFGIDLSYSFNSGKRVNMRRDETMKSLDLPTGVN